MTSMGPIRPSCSTRIMESSHRTRCTSDWLNSHTYMCVLSCVAYSPAAHPPHTRRTPSAHPPPRRFRLKEVSSQGFVLTLTPPRRFRLKEVKPAGTWEAPVPGLFPKQKMLVVTATYQPPRTGLLAADMGGGKV